MYIVNLIAFILVLIGSLNWGLIALFDWNLVKGLFGEERNFMNTLIYILVFLAAIWLIIAAGMSGGIIRLVA